METDVVSRAILLMLFVFGLILSFNSNLTYMNRGFGVILMAVPLGICFYNWFKNYKEDFNK